MRLCFYVIRSFLPSLPGGRRDADPGIKSPPGGGEKGPQGWSHTWTVACPEAPPSARGLCSITAV
jgi:hypothetical protein